RDSFFFSSSRRHTSFARDWSSDVCSSDLDQPDCIEPAEHAGERDEVRQNEQGFPKIEARATVATQSHERSLAVLIRRVQRHCPEIGRASCRERAEVVVDAVDATERACDTL